EAQAIPIRAATAQLLPADPTVHRSTPANRPTFLAQDAYLIIANMNLHGVLNIGIDRKRAGCGRFVIILKALVEIARPPADDTAAFMHRAGLPDPGVDIDDTIEFLGFCAYGEFVAATGAGALAANTRDRSRCGLRLPGAPPGPMLAVAG